MKASQITACFFAAFGVYLVVSSMIACVGAIFALVQFSRYAGEDMWLYSALQMAVPFLPAIMGIVLIFGSRTLGRLATRRALAEDSVLSCTLTMHEVARVLLIGVGAYVVTTEAPRLLHVAILIFQARAGSHEIALTAAQQVPDLPSFITAILTVAFGFVLCLRSGLIARLCLAKG